MLWRLPTAELLRRLPTISDDFRFPNHCSPTEPIRGLPNNTPHLHDSRDQTNPQCCSHTNEKPHQCNKCEKSFHRKLDLKRHEKQVYAERLSRNGNVIPVVKSFTIWLRFEHIRKQLAANPLRLPNVHAKTTQIGRVFCNDKIAFCIN